MGTGAETAAATAGAAATTTAAQAAAAAAAKAAAAKLAASFAKGGLVKGAAGKAAGGLAKSLGKEALAAGSAQGGLGQGLAAMKGGPSVSSGVPSGIASTGGPTAGIEGAELAQSKPLTDAQISGDLDTSRLSGDTPANVDPQADAGGFWKGFNDLLADKRFQAGADLLGGANYEEEMNILQPVGYRGGPAPQNPTNSGFMGLGALAQQAGQFR